jgi:hypothetical protein
MSDKGMNLKCIIKGFSTKVKESSDVITLITLEVANNVNDEELKKINAYMGEALKVNITAYQEKLVFGKGEEDKK